MRRAILLAAAFSFAEANASDSTVEFFSTRHPLRRDTAASDRVFRFDSCCPLPRCCSGSLDLRNKLLAVPIVDRAGNLDDGKDDIEQEDGKEEEEAEEAEETEEEEEEEDDDDDDEEEEEDDEEDEKDGRADRLSPGNVADRSRTLCRSLTVIPPLLRSNGVSYLEVMFDTITLVAAKPEGFATRRGVNGGGSFFFEIGRAHV